MRKTYSILLILYILFFYIPSNAQQEIPPDTLISLNEVEVQGERVRQEHFPVTIVDRLALEEVPARDVGDALRTQPNLAGIRKGGIGIDPVLRGFKFSQINVQVNEGQKIEGACPNRMDPAVSHIDVDDVERIEVFKGPYSLRFGPNFGGVIHMHTYSDQRLEKFQVGIKAMSGYESNWNGLKDHLVVTGGNKYFLLRLGGNMKKYGNYSDGNGNLVKSSFERYNYNGLIRLTPSDKYNFNFSYDRSYGRNVKYPSLPMDERSDDTFLSSFDFEAKNLGNTVKGISVKLYNSDVKHVMDNKQRPFSDTVVAVSEIRAINSGYRLELTLNASGGILHAGSDMESISKDGKRTKYFIIQPTLPTKKEKLWDEALIQNIGFFAEYTYPLRKLSLVGSVRLDLNNANSNPMTAENMQGTTTYSQSDVKSSFTNFSFSLGTDYTPVSNLTLSLDFGRGMRSPDMTERFIILLPIGFDNYDYLGNPALKPEINYQADLSALWTSPVGCLFSLDLFYSDVDNYITGEMVPESEVKPQTAGVYGVKQFINVDRAWLTGFEFTYTSSPRFKWQVEAQAAYTLGVNPLAKHYIIENKEVVGIEEVKNDPLPEIPPFEAKVNFSYRFFHRSLIPKVTIRAVAAQNRASVSYEEHATPGFVLTDISLYYKFNKVLYLTAGVSNIFNKAYYEHLNRNIVGSESILYEPGINFYINLFFKL